MYYRPDLADLKDSNILIVDDLIDSGKTLHHIFNEYLTHTLDVAVLYEKKWHVLDDIIASRDTRVFAYQSDMEQDVWLSFYYEEKIT